MRTDQQHNVSVENEVLRRHQEVLINLTRRASEQVGLDDFLAEIAMRVAEAVEIDHTKVMRHRPERGDLFTVAGVGWDPGIVGTTAFPTDMASPPGRAYQTGQPVSIESLGNEPGFRNHPVLIAHGIVSLLNVPILVDGAAWGVLEADSSVLRGFSDDTVNFRPRAPPSAAWWSAGRVRLNLDCADACFATARIATRRAGGNVEVIAPMLQACIEACRRCGDECAMHAETMNMEHCRICADACRRCERACREALSTLGHTVQ